jgi:hypothetical protein
MIFLGALLRGGVRGGVCVTLFWQAHTREPCGWYGMGSPLVIVLELATWTQWNDLVLVRTPVGMMNDDLKGEETLQKRAVLVWCGWVCYSNVIHTHTYTYVHTIQWSGGSSALLKGIGADDRVNMRCGISTAGKREGDGWDACLVWWNQISSNPVSFAILETRHILTCLWEMAFVDSRDALLVWNQWVILFALRFSVDEARVTNTLVLVSLMWKLVCNRTLRMLVLGRLCVLCFETRDTDDAQPNVLWVMAKKHNKHNCFALC